MRLFLILFFFILQPFAYAADKEGFIVIVNEGGPLAEASMEDVREVYLGEKRFGKGMKLLPVNFTEGPLKDLFLKKIVGMSSKDYKHHWIKKVFQEGLNIPATMGSTSDIIEFVSKEKGAVAYLPPEWANTILHGTVRNETERFLTPKGIEQVKIIGP
jgi:hypothetical protein